MLDLIGTEISEACCLSVVAALDKFHRRLLAVQRVLGSDEQKSLSLITEVARIVCERSADALLVQWKEHLLTWRETWTNDNQQQQQQQPHGSVKMFESVLIELVHRTLVALTV